MPVGLGRGQLLADSRHVCHIYGTIGCPFRLPCTQRLASGRRLLHRQHAGRISRRQATVLGAAADSAPSRADGNPVGSLLRKILHGERRKDSTGQVGNSVLVRYDEQHITEWNRSPSPQKALVPRYLCLPQGNGSGGSLAAIPQHWSKHLETLREGKQRDLQRCFILPILRPCCMLKAEAAEIL